MPPNFKAQDPFASLPTYQPADQNQGDPLGAFIAQVNQAKAAAAMANLKEGNSMELEKAKIASAEKIAGMKNDSAEATAATKSGAVSAKNKTAAWRDFNKETNPNLASSRSVLGLAGQAQKRVQSAKAMLNDPGADQQVLANTLMDIGAIMKGGAPDEQQLKETKYNTIQSKFNNLLTFVTNSPAAVKQPAVVARLNTVLDELSDVNRQVILDNYEAAEPRYAGVLMPGDLAKQRDIITRSMGGHGAAAKGGGKQQAGPDAWKQDPDIQAVVGQIKSKALTPEAGSLQMKMIRQKKGI